jgi:putative membrane protein
MFRNGQVGMHNLGQVGNHYPFIMGIMALRFVVFIIILVVIIKYVKKHHLNNSYAISVLNERYAKGEIDEEEYIKKKAILRK